MRTPHEGTTTDAESDRSGVVGLLRRGVGWLQDLHRGFAYTGHLPRRRK